MSQPVISPQTVGSGLRITIGGRADHGRHFRELSSNQSDGSGGAPRAIEFRFAILPGEQSSAANRHLHQCTSQTDMVFPLAAGFLEALA